MAIHCTALQTFDGIMIKQPDSKGWSFYHLRMQWGSMKKLDLGVTSLLFFNVKQNSIRDTQTLIPFSTNLSVVMTQLFVRVSYILSR